MICLLVNKFTSRFFQSSALAQERAFSDIDGSSLRMLGQDAGDNGLRTEYKQIVAFRLPV